LGKKTLPLILAVLTAVLLAMALWPRKAPATTMVVATRDLGAGAVLQASDLQVETIPAKLAPPNAVHRVDALVGKTLAVVVFQGQPVTTKQIGPAVRLAPDERSIAVNVTVAQGLAGLLRPGMRVDVIATMKSQQQFAAMGVGGGIYAKAVLEGVRVLYVPPEFQAKPYQTPVSLKSSSSSTAETHALRSSVLVLAASTSLHPIYYLPEATEALLAHGKVHLTSKRTVTVTLPLTMTATVTNTLTLAKKDKSFRALLKTLPTLQPVVRYVAPVELLAALNAEGKAITLVGRPTNANSYLSGGVDLSALTPYTLTLPGEITVMKGAGQ